MKSLFGSVLLLTSIAFAHDRGVLNGTWTLEPSKSDFAGQPVVQTGTVTIHDKDGAIFVERSFKYEGANETFFYNDVTDGDTGSTIHSGKDLKSKTKWDHDSLKVTTTRSGATTLETYSITEDGALRVNVQRPGRQPIVLVFRRQ